MFTKAEYEVQNAFGVEQNGEDHANGDGISYVRNEEYGLQYLLKRLDRIQTHGNQQGDYDGYRNRDEGDKQGIRQRIRQNVGLEINARNGACRIDIRQPIGSLKAIPAVYEVLRAIFAGQRQNGEEVIQSEARTGLGRIVIILKEGDYDGVDQRIESEDGQENDDWGEI